MIKTSNMISGNTTYKLKGFQGLSMISEIYALVQVYANA